MQVIRKRELIVTRERSLTFKFGDARAAEIFCSVCAEATQFITVDEAAIFRRSTARQIYRLVEAKEIHFNETADGKLLVCFTSLSKIADESFSPSMPDPNNYETK